MTSHRRKLSRECYPAVRALEDDSAAVAPPVRTPVAGSAAPRAGRSGTAGGASPASHDRAIRFPRAGPAPEPSFLPRSLRRPKGPDLGGGLDAPPQPRRGRTSPCVLAGSLGVLAGVLADLGSGQHPAIASAERVYVVAGGRSGPAGGVLPASASQRSRERVLTRRTTFNQSLHPANRRRCNRAHTALRPPTARTDL
jgi:hypothetical protein